MISNVVHRYKYLLEQSGLDFTGREVLIDPPEDKFKDVDNVIVLQQGQYDWLDNQECVDKVDYVITLSPVVKEECNKKHLKTIVLPFPISDIFQKKSKWTDREDVLYYHGRMIPSKTNVKEIENILKYDFQVVMRGPICKHYWADEDLKEKIFTDFKEQLLEIDKQYDNLTLLPGTQDQDLIIEELNKYKFYFTLSTGEAFNVALQEAIACGTIPIVKSNGAYWWADHLTLQFSYIGDLILKFNTCKDLNLEEYSDTIAEEIKRRCSFESIKKSYDEQIKSMGFRL